MKTNLLEEMKMNMGVLPTDPVGELTKYFIIKDKKAFQFLKDIMEQTIERKEEERVEAIMALFSYSYQYGCITTGKKAMEQLFQLMQFTCYHKYYSNLMLNVAFYALPINVVIKHNLRQRLFNTLNNLNPFLFRDKVTNDYVVGSRIMSLTRNKGSDYEIYVFTDEGELIHNFALKYQFNYKRFARLGATYGVEDVRVINIPDKTDVLLASGTTMDTHAQGMMRMSLFYMYVQRDKKKHIEGITAKNLVPLQGFNDDKRQKNWLPFFHTHTTGHTPTSSTTPSSSTHSSTHNTPLSSTHNSPTRSNIPSHNSTNDTAQKTIVPSSQKASKTSFHKKSKQPTTSSTDVNIVNNSTTTLPANKKEGTKSVDTNGNTVNDKKGGTKSVDTNGKTINDKGDTKITNDPQLYFIYAFEPLTIVRAKLNSLTNEEKSYSGIVEKIKIPNEGRIIKNGFTLQQNMLSKARGSAPPILYTNDQQEQAYVMIVHYAESKHKKYYHRFVEMDLQFNIMRISRIFYFEKCHAVEFAINMIEHHDRENGNGFLISYGIVDKVSRVSFLSFYDLSRSWLV